MNTFQTCTLLLPCLAVFASGAPAAEDYKIVNELLPGYSEIPEYVGSPELYTKPTEMYSGRISVDNEEEEEEEGAKKFFFWKFNTVNGSKDKLVIWINGGPGCSSMDGALLENGPFRVNSGGNLIANNGSWHMYSDVLYIDQPLGTGFSYKVDEQSSEGEGGASLKDVEFYDADIQNDLNAHFVNFLLNYFKIFPQDLEKEIILSGESYAGQYIIHFVDYMMKYNEESSTNFFNVKKILLGNAWVDPMEQGLSYLSFMKQENLIDSQNSKLKDLMHQQEVCQNTINSDFDQLLDNFSIDPCESILFSAIGSAVDEDFKCLNVYDYRLVDDYPSCGMTWPFDLPNVTKFFSKKGVMETLHLDESHRWQECNAMVANYLKNKHSTPAIRILPDVLSNGIQVYLFNGDKDLICNSLGVWNYAKKLVWNDEKFSVNETTNKHVWYHDMEESGYFYKDRNLVFLNIYNASHMVPVDKPLENRGMLTLFDLVSHFDLDYNEFDVYTSIKRSIDDEDYDDVESNYIHYVIKDGETEGTEGTKETESEEDEFDDEKQEQEFDEDESEDDSDYESDEENNEEEGFEEQPEDYENEEEGYKDEEEEEELYDDEEEEQHRQTKHALSVFFLYVVIIGLGGFIARYIIKTLYSKKKDRFNRLDAEDSLDFDDEGLVVPAKKKKTVSWADDIENVDLGNHQEDFEMTDTFDLDDELESGKNTHESTPDKS